MTPDQTAEALVWVILLAGGLLVLCILTYAVERYGRPRDD